MRAPIFEDAGAIPSPRRRCRPLLLIFHAGSTNDVAFERRLLIAFTRRVDRLRSTLLLTGLLLLRDLLRELHCRLTAFGLYSWPQCPVEGPAGCTGSVEAD